MVHCLRWRPSLWKLQTSSRPALEESWELHEDGIGDWMLIPAWRVQRLRGVGECFSSVKRLLSMSHVEDWYIAEIMYAGDYLRWRQSRWRLVWLLGLACALKTEDCADCVQPERERYAPTWTLNLETREYKVLRFEINNFNAATCVHTSCDLRGEFVWGKFYIHFHLRWMTEAP